MSRLHFHPLRVAALRRDAEDALVIGLDVPADLRETFAFEPGQHLALRATLHGQELRRSYSICAAPGDALRVGVRHVPGGAFSTWLHAALRVGDTLDVMPPEGRIGAALAQRPRHVLAVAGGSGITPLLSILKAVLAGDARARCSLLYGNRSLATAMFKDELDDLKNRHLSRLAVHHTFSREAVDSLLHGGRIDTAKLGVVLRLAGLPDAAFVCGPHAMNDEVEAALRSAGLAPGQIHIERYGVPPAMPAAAVATQSSDAAQARLSIVRDGVTREVPFGPDDASILAAATRAGMELPYSCRSGVCATCRARVLEGQVRMDRNFALEPDDLAAGFVLTCQAHPVSERVRLSFDQR
jgi:ring-1,2-phenylacetyl-CoA epoxidase subunit PaaE